MSKLILGVIAGIMTALFTVQTAMIDNSMNKVVLTHDQVCAGYANYQKNHTLK